MIKIMFWGICMLFVCVGTISAQGKETIEARPIDVDGHIKDSPAKNEGKDPSVGEKGEGKGGNSRGSNKGAGGKSGNKATSINGKPTKVSPQAVARVNAFLARYKNIGAFGHFVTSFASILGFLGIVESPTAPTAIFDQKEVITILTAPAIWAKANRTQALDYVKLEILHAYTNNKNDEARMWQHVGDIIRNPERYRDNVEFDAKKQSLKLLLFEEEYREIPAYNIPLKEMDRQLFNSFLGELKTRHPETDENLMLMELIFYVEKPNQFTSISVRDEMILNTTLMNLPENSKSYWRRIFNEIKFRPGTTATFWESLITFLDEDAWGKNTIRTGIGDWDVIETTF